MCMNKTEETMFENIDLYFYSFSFKRITVSLKSFKKKNVIVEEELDFIDIDGIGNREFT